MKEDYLWDKTGNDPEIEKLEIALKAFRQQDAIPPAIPAKIIHVKQETPRRVFPFAFAFATSVAFVLILAGVWFQASNEKRDMADNSANAPKHFKAVKVSNEDQVEKSIESEVEEEDEPFETPKIEKLLFKTKTDKPKRIRVTKPIKIKTKTPGQIKAVKNISDPKREIVKLTKEEKYAYDQLMLALSITSEKLNLVKAKIQGEAVEEISPKKSVKNRSN